MSLQTFIEQWAKDNANLHLKPHQASRVLNDLTHYLQEKNIAPQAFCDNVKNKDPFAKADLLDILTVQESYFFRDEALFTYLEHTFLPQLIQTKIAENDLTINIWSAGCSQGEEIYSMVILLSNLLPNNKNWTLYYSATDINPKALEKAKEGLYQKGNLRASSALFIDKYFTQENHAYRLNQSLREQVTFSHFNIGSLAPPLKNFDLIFCRNVFIYLTEQSIQQAMTTFHSTLKDKGALLLGPSDLITYVPHNFIQKQEQGASLLLPNVKENIKYPPPLPLRIKLSYTEKQQLKLESTHAISNALKNNDYAKTIRLSDDYLEQFDACALIYRYKSEALIQQGDINAAKQCLTQSIMINGLDAKSHFLKALTLSEQASQSIASLKKALYLNAHFPEAHYHLALLLLSTNEKEKGIKHLKQAKKAAEEKSANTLVLCSNQTMQHLLEAIEEDIAHYQGARL